MRRKRTSKTPKGSSPASLPLVPTIIRSTGYIRLPLVPLIILDPPEPIKKKKKKKR